MEANTNFARMYREAVIRFQVSEITGNPFTVKADWSYTIRSLTELRQWFIRSLNRKINRNDTRKKWRKFSEIYQTNQLRDKYVLSDILENNGRHYQFSTKVCTEKFGHLLSHYDD